MSEFAKRVIPTFTLLVLGLMLLGIAGEAALGQEKKSKFGLKKTDPIKKNVEPAKKSDIEVFSFSFANGRVLSVDAANRTFVLRSTDRKHKGEFRDYKVLLRDKTVVIRGDRVGAFVKIEIKEGDDVSISDQGAAGNLTSYIMVKQGTTENSTLRHGIIESCAPKKATISLNYQEIKSDYVMRATNVFVNMRESTAEDLMIGDRAHFIVSGTNQLTHVFVDRQ